MNIAVLTISDRSADGLYEDRSGPLLADIVQQRTGWTVIEKAVVRDEIDEIRLLLARWSAERVNLILTTGGTGFSPRDVTPEATRKVIDREAPGIAEVLRHESLKITPHAMLSRGIAGIAGSTLIVNLPGNPKAVRENMEVLLPVLPHALELLSGKVSGDRDHSI